jgi:hypothetical protein
VRKVAPTLQGPGRSLQAKAHARFVHASADATVSIA